MPDSTTGQADDALTPRWPGGQLDRYRTAGGGRIDLIPGEKPAVELDCNGCGHHETVASFAQAWRNKVIAGIRANEHAALCHTIPPPAK